MCSSLNMVAQSLIKLPYSYTYSFINRFRPFRIRLQRYIPQQCISETDIRIDHRIITLCSRQLDPRDGYYILLQEREEWIHSNYRLLEPHYDIATLYTITTHYYLYIRTVRWHSDYITRAATAAHRYCDNCYNIFHCLLFKQMCIMN